MSFYEEEEARQRERTLLHNDEDGEHPSGDSGDYAAAQSSPDPDGYYKALGVRPSATAQEIRKAFLFLSQRYHTDKHIRQGEAVQEAMNARFQELQDAYTVLSDERQRAAYDAAGSKGSARLALVPAHYTTRNDIMQYIRSLDREADLIQTARMLMATSDITIQYSVASLFLTPAAKRQMLEGASADIDGPGEATKTGPGGEHGKVESSPANGPSSPSPAKGGQSEGPESAHGDGGASPWAPEKGKVMQAQMIAKEVVIDGKRQVVFIPPAEMQTQIQERLRAAQGAAAAAAVHGQGGGDGAVGRSVDWLGVVAKSAVPTSMVFRHSFLHSVNRRMTLLFQTHAGVERGSSRMSMTTYAEFNQDSVNLYAALLRMTTKGLKLALVKERALTPVWRLRTKLTCLRDSQLLQKLELTLLRKLSAAMELTNTIAWSLNERGFFSSRIARVVGEDTQAVSTHISFHDMNLTALCTSAVTYGTDTGDPKHPPARGRVQYSVHCSPFSGQTQAGFEAWYYHAPRQHYGLAFMTVIPYSFSPIAPPLFFVESSQHAVVNQVSILYARGQHQIRVPVVVFFSPHVSRALLWLGLPLFCYRVAWALYRPYAKAKAARYYTKVRLEHLTEMDVAREKAALEQRALELLILQSRASEDRRGGLVIVNAQYGVLSPDYLDEGQQTGVPAASPTTRKAQDRFRHAPPVFSRLFEGFVGSLRRSFTSSQRRRRSSASSPLSEASSSPTAHETDTGENPASPASPPAEQPRQPHEEQQGSPHSPVEEGGDAAAAEDAVVDIPLSIDVTIALQNMVRDSALILPAGTKCTLVGFCDPDPFVPERKQLKVTYRFRGRKHCAVFEDEDPVELPQREHRVE